MVVNYGNQHLFKQQMKLFFDKQKHLEKVTSVLFKNNVSMTCNYTLECIIFIFVLTN